MTTEPAAAAPRTLWQALTRLFAIAVVVGALGYMGRMYWSLARGLSKASGESEDLEPALSAMSSAPPGPWTMGGLAWDLRTVEVGPDDLAGWLDGPVTASDVPADGLATALVDLLRDKAQVAVRDGMRVYSGDEAGAKFRVFCRNEGGLERVVAARALVQEGEGWRGLEARPGVRTARSQQGERGLLPWPDDCKRLAVRRDEAEQTVAELIHAPQGLPLVLQRIRDGGWRIEGESNLVCTGPNGERVALWAPNDKGGETAALAVRLRSGGRKR